MLKKPDGYKNINNTQYVYIKQQDSVTIIKKKQFII